MSHHPLLTLKDHHLRPAIPEPIILFLFLGEQTLSGYLLEEIMEGVSGGGWLTFLIGLFSIHLSQEHWSWARLLAAPIPPVLCWRLVSGFLSRCVCLPEAGPVSAKKQGYWKLLHDTYSQGPFTSQSPNAQDCSLNISDVPMNTGHWKRASDLVSHWKHCGAGEGDSTAGVQDSLQGLAMYRYLADEWRRVTRGVILAAG